MKTNILTLAITMTVGVILMGSLLVPILDDNTKDDHYYNEYGNRASEMDSATIVFESGNPVLDINGNEVEPARHLIAIFDTGYITVGTSNNVPVMNLVQLYNGHATNRTMIAADLDFSEGTLSGDVTYTNETTGTFTVTYTWLAVYDESGSLTLIESNAITNGVEIYVKDLDQVKNVTAVLIDGVNEFVYCDGESALINGTTSETVTCDLTLVDGDLYKFKAVNNSTGDYSVPVGTSEGYALKLCVPYELVVPNKMFDAGMKSLLYAIPILFIIGLVLVAVRTIGINKD